MQRIHSPLTGSTNVVLQEEIQCDFIIDKYKKRMKIDVSKYFQGLESIQIYKCLDTRFRFYYPFNLEGNGEFYEELQKFQWYCMDWKWEHEIASMIIGSVDKVLEIGCARGSFMERVQQKGIECVGLELNKSAIKTGCRKGLNILSQSIQEHAKQNPEKYDLVCSFQVVEHISAIKEFIQASVDALKPGGKLIMSVPNNYPNSPILENNILNMPPHHMGLWDMNSLISVQRIFGIELRGIELEPLQPYHRGYADILVQKGMDVKMLEKYGILGKIIKREITNRFGRRFISYTASKLSKYMIGHTILVQYRKL